jgi:hypothetical protein
MTGLFLLSLLENQLAFKSSCTKGAIMKSFKPMSAALCLMLTTPAFSQAAEVSEGKTSPVPADASPINKILPVTQPVKIVRDQDKAEGFLEGSHAKLTLRNYYTRQTTHRSTSLSIQKPWGTESTDLRNTWIQAAMLDFRSGYTQGALGFGLDLSLWGATNLERGKGQLANGSDRTLVHGDGEAVPAWSRIGVADVRLRVSNTELKFGRLMPENPILRAKENRSLPSSFDGVSLTSNELDRFAFQAGYVNRVVPRTGTDTDKFLSTFGNRAVSGDSISYAGVNIKPWYGLSTSLYASRFENVWDRYYVGLTHRSGDPKIVGWKNVVTMYHTRDQGSRELGYIDNTIASYASTLARGAHSLTLAYQQNFGNEYFDYPWETSANFNNISLYSDFNGPNEKSWMAKYDVDFAAYGVPGLTTGVWYARGWGIDGTHYDGDRNGARAGYNVRGLDGVKHWEIGLTAGYVVQSGQLKNCTFRTIVFHHRAEPGQIDGSYDELRLVANLPFDLF